MKHIRLKKEELPIETMIGPNRGKFRVTLYWSQSYYFTSKKKALRFIAIANQFYTQCMYEARSIYIDVWVTYQRAWGYFDHGKGGSNFLLADKDRTCQAALNDCQESFNLMEERCDYVGFIVPNKLSLIIKRMQSVISILKEINSRSGGTFELYALDVLAKRVYGLEYSIKSFGDYEAENLNKRPIHESFIQPSTLISNAKMSVA